MFYNILKYIERVIYLWIAKNKDNGKEYPKKFSSIYDCQNYIDNELRDDLVKANKDYLIKTWNIFACNRILCYNVEQQRFCDSFDF